MKIRKFGVANVINFSFPLTGLQPFFKKRIKLLLGNYFSYMVKNCKQTFLKLISKYDCENHSSIY